MSGSCFRSSSFHGRHAFGALVMMVLIDKGIERVDLDTQSDSSSSTEVVGCMLAMDLRCGRLIFVSKEGRESKVTDEISRTCTVCSQEILPSATARNVGLVPCGSVVPQCHAPASGLAPCNGCKQ